MNKKILKYVSQSVLGMIGVSVYILADTYFISYGFGADGLTVLNLILPIYGLIYAIGQMLGLDSRLVTVWTREEENRRMATSWQPYAGALS